MRRVILRSSLPGVLLAIAVLLPFGGKAFTIDDTLFLLQAKHLLTDPLHPTAFEAVWSEFPAPLRLSQIMPSGPVQAWLLVPSILAGGSEWLAHLVELAAMVVAVLATVALAFRLGVAPPWAMAAGLFLAATPAALGMAGTAMPDVPAMALGVAGVERLVAWRDERRLGQAVSAALLLGLAPLARTHMILVLAIGALLAAGEWLDRRAWIERPFGTWIPVIAAPAITVVVALVTRDPAGGSGDLARSAWFFSDVSRIPRNAVAFATHWVLVLPFAVPWLVARGRETEILRRWWVLVLATAVAAVTLLASPFSRWAPVIAPIAGIGTSALVDLLADAWKRRDTVQLALGMWMLVPLPIAVYLHFPSKYLLAAAPAAAIAVARELSRRSARLARGIAAVTVVAGAAVGIAVLRADAAFADLGRRAAAELIAPEVASGKSVWFVGHWGFQWYAERAGGRALTLSQPYPRRGDLVVISRDSMPQDEILMVMLSQYPGLVHLAHLEDRTPGGRVMDERVGAGFFSNGRGYLPWAWGDDRLDAFDLGRFE